VLRRPIETTRVTGNMATSGLYQLIVY
jgi:hypothetical protein